MGRHLCVAFVLIGTATCMQKPLPWDLQPAVPRVSSKDVNITIAPPVRVAKAKQNSSATQPSANATSAAPVNTTVANDTATTLMLRPLRELAVSAMSAVDGEWSSEKHTNIDPMESLVGTCVVVLGVGGAVWYAAARLERASPSSLIVSPGRSAQPFTYPEFVPLSLRAAGQSLRSSQQHPPPPRCRAPTTTYTR